METQTATKRKKVNSRGTTAKPRLSSKIMTADRNLTGALDSIQDLFENKSEIKATLDDLVSSERRLYEAGSKQFKKLSKQFKANWKSVVPGLAAVGLCAFLLHKYETKH